MKLRSWVALTLLNLALAGRGISFIRPLPAAWISANTINYAPKSRTVVPVHVFATSGSVSSTDAFRKGGETRISGQGSEITFDFGNEVGGILSIDVAAASDPKQSVGIAFTESSLSVGRESDSSSIWGTDGAVVINVSRNGPIAIPQDKLRGGFRYVTVFMNSSGWVDLRGVSLHFIASPQMKDMRAYPNYFLSNDDLLNKIWYAGAYTVQLNTIDPRQGREWPPPSTGWENNAVISDGTSVLVDGAKRDRTVWPGDLGISQPTAFVSTNDTASARSVLNILYAQQDARGGLPYCGPPVNCGTVSDTYHLWTLIASSDYYVETRDKAWLDSHWQQYKAAIQFSMRKIDGNGVLSVNLPADWGRIIMLSGENLSPNVLLYRALSMGAYLAEQEGDEPTAQKYRYDSANLKKAVNLRFWDRSSGQYRDTPGQNLHPQDGNALAVWFQVFDSPEKASSISHALQSNWNRYGAQTPERPKTIATFPGSMEVISHFVANDDQAGLDLIRLEWGYMLNSPMGTKSTFWEGYLSDGSFDYATSSMSKAHGWATGPTSALTYFVLGIMPEVEHGFDYRLIPHPGDLKRVAGRLTLSKGTVDVSWERSTDAATFKMTVGAPERMSGRVGLPTFGRHVTVAFDGKLVWNGCGTSNAIVSAGPFERISSDNSYVYFEGIKGSHTLTSTASCGL
jgi:hypothetical protein